MKINEAIKLLQKDIDDPGSVDIIDVNRAEQLGIEALKRLKISRDPSGVPSFTLLPGETEEEQPTRDERRVS